MARWPAAKALIVTPTRSATHRVASGDSFPCSWAPLRPTVLTTSTTRSGVSLLNTPTVITSGGMRRAMWATTLVATCRGDGANTNPRASAPRATARSASSSLVVPHTFTNTAARSLIHRAGLPGRPCSSYRTPSRTRRSGDLLLHEGPHGGFPVRCADQGLPDEDRIEAGPGEAGRVRRVPHPGPG